MATVTVYTCPNEDCSCTTEFHSPGYCPKCGTRLVPQMALEHEKDDEREM